jgi:hypothetical protein
MTYTKLHEGMQPIQLGGGGGGGGGYIHYLFTTSIPFFHYYHSIFPSHLLFTKFSFPTTLCCISIDTHIGMIHKDKEKAFLYSVMLSYAH